MSDIDLQKKNAKTVRIVFAVVAGMIALAFASVPLYTLFCRVTGWGGTTQSAEAIPDESEIIDRVVSVRFDTNTARDLPWTFDAEILSMDVRLGERGFVNYVSENTSDTPVAGTAVFNVTPLKAGKYFHKVQCFCFDEQILQPNERMNMPVLFYVDPALHDDPQMSDVKTITLSYTFFKTNSDSLDAAMEAFYEDAVVD